MQPLEQINLFDLTPGTGCPVRIFAATLPEDRQGRKRLVSGAGATLQEAMARCRSEANERHYASVSQSGRLAVVRQSYTSLGDSAIYPPSISLYSDRQYQDRDNWNASHAIPHQIPQPFDANGENEWLCGYEAKSDRLRYVPAAACLLGYPDALDRGFPVPDSSGLASASTLEGARESALLELIERDAVAIWWYNHALRPEIVDHSVHPLCLELVNWEMHCGRRAWLLDITHDIAVPAVAAISSNQDGRDLAFGFGCGWTLSDAGAAAARELVQFEVTKSFRRSTSGSLQDDWIDWTRTASIHDHVFLKPHDVEARSVALAPSRSDLVEDLNSRGVGVVFVELHSDDEAQFVVRAIAPGLRPWWPRFAPGRLYDVPRLLAWKRQHTRLGLNPVPILF